MDGEVPIHTEIMISKLEKNLETVVSCGRNGGSLPEQRVL